MAKKKPPTVSADVPGELYLIPLLFSPQAEGGFTVTSPVLPELVTEGDTLAEAFANAVEHPYEPSSRVIEVQGDCADDVVTLVIHDFGSWRERRERKDGGYGFPLMRRMMDTVDVQAEADGTTITLQRRLVRGSA